MEEDSKPVNKKPTKAHIMETYGDDMINVISTDTSGLVQRIIHEQERRELEKKNYSPYSSQNKFFLFVSLLLISLTLGLVGYFYFFYNSNKYTNVIPQFKLLILNDDTGFIDVTLLDRDEIAAKVQVEKESTKIAKGQLEGVYFAENKKVIGFSRLNELLATNIPPNSKLLINDNFLLGIASFEIKDEIPANNTEKPVSNINTPNSLEVLNDPAIVDPLRYAPEKPTRKDLFILLSVKSFGEVFPIMRTWEPKIMTDLSGVFGIDTKGAHYYLLDKEWEDGIVQNKNARILRDKDGNIVLMYVYTDNNHIIFASTEDVVREVITRLAASKVGK